MIHWAAPVATTPVRGRVDVPGSKSATARSLLLATLAEGPSTLTGVLDSRDTSLMRAGLATLGALFEDLPDGHLRVHPATSISGGGTIDCGLAGTVMRFLPPVAALGSPATRFVGDEPARMRPIAALLAALDRLGAEVSEPHRLPFSVGAGPGFRGGPVSLDASASSQFVSALLLAGARYQDGVQVSHVGGPLPSLPHIEMTCTLLKRRGVEVDRLSDTSWRVVPGPICAVDEQVEPDLTNAATVLAAALVTGGQLDTAWPEESVQATEEFAQVLVAFGARIRYFRDDRGRRISVSGAGGVRGARVNLRAISEFTPAAAALAAVADGPSVITGVAHIRGHETDRLAALAAELTGLGVGVRETEDGLEITPAPRHGGVFHTYADHRLAHAGALIGLVTPGVELDDVSCTTKTLPDFPGLWSSILADSA